MGLFAPFFYAKSSSKVWNGKLAEVFVKIGIADEIEEDSIEEFTVDLTYQYWQLADTNSGIEDTDTDEF